MTASPKAIPYPARFNSWNADNIHPEATNSVESQIQILTAFNMG
jgi:hypothetical protein